MGALGVNSNKNESDPKSWDVPSFRDELESKGWEQMIGCHHSLCVFLCKSKKKKSMRRHHHLSVKRSRPYNATAARRTCPP